jgi:hypothetical protein
MMATDYAFSPGVDLYEESSRELFRRKSNTQLIDKPGITTVQQFIGDVNQTAPPPIGDLYLGSHASDEGNFHLPLYPNQTDKTSYEHLAATLDKANLSIKIPDSLIGYTPGDPLTHTVHIRGCSIGKARPFLLKFQEALGGHVHVTAPNFFHVVGKTENLGSFEYLHYDFSVHRDAAFSSRNEAVSQFERARHQLYNGVDVPNSAWETLIPTNPNESSPPEDMWLNVSIPGSTTKQIKVQRLYVVWNDIHKWNIRYSDPTAIPRTRPERLAALKTQLLTEKPFQSTHPFPFWSRYGFASLDAYIDGYDWQFSTTVLQLICHARRRFYSIRLPITEPTAAGKFIGAGKLFYNFYPDKGSPIQPVRNLSIGDPKFFTTV